MHKPQLYWDLLALALVLAGALLVAVLVWLLMRRYREQMAHSVECTPPKLCSPVTSPLPPTDDGSWLQMSPEPQTTDLSDPSNRRAAHEAPSPSTMRDVKGGGSEQRPKPKAVAEPEAENKTKLPPEANDQQKESQLTKHSQRKKGKSRSGDEKSCSSKVKRKSKHHAKAPLLVDDAKPAVVSRPGTEAGGVVAATVADGDAVGLNISPTGAKVCTPLPASEETPASLPTPVSIAYTAASAQVSAVAGSQFVSPTTKNGEHPPGLVAAVPSPVPSSTTPALWPLCEPLPQATAAPSDPTPSPSRRRRLTRSKGSKGSGSSRRSDHHRETQAHHSPAQLGAIPRDQSTTQAAEDAAQHLSQVFGVKAPGADSPAVTAKARAEHVPAAALFACSPQEPTRMSGTH